LRWRASRSRPAWWQACPAQAGNVTGLSLEAPDLGGKRLGLLREVAPGARRLAVLADIAYPASLLELEHIKAAAPTLGFDCLPLEVQRA
jgi:putative tryptophan/tyrosine transport system substrate-binding protein